MGSYKTKKLGELIDIFDSQRIPVNSRDRNNMQGEYPYYGASGIVDYVDDYIFNGKYLLIAEDGANLLSRKTPIAFFAYGKFWVNNHAHIVKGKNGVLVDKYLEAYLNANDLSGYVTGTAQPKLSQANLKRIKVRLPDFGTQQKVASILSAFDDLIENNTRRIAILEEMARLIYREWFVHYRYPGHEEDELVDSGTDFGKVPEGWEVKKLEDFGRIETGKTPPKKDPENYGSYMPFIKTPDMHDQMFIIEFSEGLSKKGVELQKNKTLPLNSLIVNCIGAGAGVVSITSKSSHTNQQINAIILENKKAREFLYLSLARLRPKLRKIGSAGATMINVSKGKFQALEVVWPGEELIEKYHEKVASIFDQIQVLQKQNIKLKETRDLLLPKLISGKLEA